METSEYFLVSVGRQNFLQKCLLYTNKVTEKTNNVSFKTMPQKIEKWKQVVKGYFGDSKLSTLNEGAVFKVLFDTARQDEKNKSVKMNFYKSGSVVICELFSLGLGLQK